MIIDFNEQKFRSEVKSMVRPFGLNKRQVEQVISQALLAVRRASRPV
ncbi:hypothetical protein [Propionispora sp. 2/2-37]|nr:hypothetical protein [Propionispora sp. 2/2-37]